MNHKVRESSSEMIELEIAMKEERAKPHPTIKVGESPSEMIEIEIAMKEEHAKPHPTIKVEESPSEMIEIEIAMKEERAKPHRCSHPGCGRSFDRPYRLAHHLLTHDNIKAFSCTEDGCTKSYTNKSHLDRHIKTSHSQSEKVVLYSCPRCQNVYANRQNLKRHIKTAHTQKSKMLSCDICKIEFQKKHHLSSHMYGHTGIKPFSCEECLKEFVTLHDKRRHRRFHRIHTCTECGLKFNHWSKYNEHTKMHLANKEFICNECGRKFKQRVHIVRHVKTHSIIAKKFLCPYENCNRSYSRNSNLTQHILMKHEKILHECEICKAKLSTKQKLREHMMKLHGGMPKDKLAKPKTGPRKPRKDAGVLKSSTAEKLAGIRQTLQEFESRLSNITPIEQVNQRFVLL